MPRSAALIALLLSLAACTPDTVLISPDQIADFEPGKTNQTEVIAALGKPTHTITEADGTKIDQYPYNHGAGSGSMVPGWLGGASVPDVYGMLSFSYSSSGVLKAIGGK